VDNDMSYSLIIIYIFVFIVVSSLFKKKYGYLTNTNFYVTLIWVFFAIISIINPLDFRQPRLEVHIYSLIFIVCYNLFCYSFKIEKRTLELEHIESSLLASINRRLFVVEIFALLAYSPIFFLSLSAFLSGNAADVRMSIYYGEEANFFNKTIPVAILTALQTISIYLYFRTQKRKYLFNALLIVAITSITSAGRGSIFSFIVLYFYANHLFSKSNIKKTKLPLYLAICGMFLMTVSVRGGNFLRSIVSYFSGSFSLLDYILQNPHDYGLDNYHYGLITLSPITEPLLYILKVLRITTEKIPSYWININVQEFVDIGSVRNIAMYNNNTTTLLPFLLDGGVVGIIFGSLFLAFFSVFFYNKFVKQRMIGAIYYLYIVSGLFLLTISYQTFMGVTPGISFLIIYFVIYPYYSKKNKAKG